MTKKTNKAIATNTEIKEEMEMKNNTTKIGFTLEGIIYTTEKVGYYYAQPVGGIKKRVSKDVFSKAYVAYVNDTTTDEEWQAQADADKAQQDLAKQARYAEEEKAILGRLEPTLPEGYTIKSVWDGDCTSYHLYKGDEKIAADWEYEPLRKMAWEAAGEATEKAEDKKTGETPAKKDNAKKATKKPRKSKDIAYEGHGKTLTAKQVDFIKHIPDTCFYEAGLESTPWCDVLAEEIGGQFANKPMTVGAMISTLREKDLIYVGTEKVNGRKAKYFGFTEIGKAVAKELGLN